MGYGLPAAIGAAIGNEKRRTVVNIAGDGSFNMNMQELATAARYELDIVELIMDNRSLGMIEKWQNERLDGRVNYCELPKLDYSSLADAFGVGFFEANDLPDLKNALLLARARGGVCLIDYRMQELI